MKKVLVTGGSGVVGRAAIDHLLARGHTVRLLCRDAEQDARAWDGRVEPRPGDVADAASLRGCAEGCDAVLHLAGIVAEEPPECTFARVNVEGTRNMVREAARAGVARLVYVSSLGAERGSSDYHRSKLAGEEVVRAEFPGDWLVIRLGNVYGPGDEVISLLLKLVRTLPAVPVVGDGEQPFQPIWAEDAGEALARAAEGPEPTRATLAVAGPERTTQRELLDRLERITDRHPLHIPLPEPLARFGTGAAEQLGIDVPLHPDQLTMLRECNVIEPPEKNALHEVFGVSPTPLEAGLLLLADSLPEKLPSDGKGALHEQRFQADIQGAELDVDGVMELLRTEFASLPPPALLRVGVEPGTPVELAEGRTLTLEIPFRGHVQVRVEEMTERRVTLMTLGGHHIFGAIRFAASDHDGLLRFEIRSYTRAATVLDLVARELFGRVAQRMTWKQTVEEVVRRSGGEAVGGVQVEETTLDERDAARVERWADELVLRRQRSESSAAPDPVPG